MNLLVYLILLVVFVILISVLLHKSNKTGGVDYTFDNSAPIADINSYDLTKFILSDFQVDSARTQYEFYATVVNNIDKVSMIINEDNVENIDTFSTFNIYNNSVNKFKTLLQNISNDTINDIFYKTAISAASSTPKESALFNKCIYFKGISGNSTLMTKEELFTFIDIHTLIVAQRARPSLKFIYNYMCFCYPNVAAICNGYIFGNNINNLTKNYLYPVLMPSVVGNKIFYSTDKTSDPFLSHICKYTTYYNNGHDVKGFFPSSPTEKQIKDFKDIDVLHTRWKANYRVMKDILLKYQDNIVQTDNCKAFYTKISTLEDYPNKRNSDIDNILLLRKPIFMVFYNKTIQKHEMYMLLNMDDNEINLLANSINFNGSYLWSKYNFTYYEKIQLCDFIINIDVSYPGPLLPTDKIFDYFMPNSINFIKWALSNGIPESVLHSIMLYGATNVNYVMIKKENSLMINLNRQYLKFPVLVFNSAQNIHNYYYSIITFIDHAFLCGISLTQAVENLRVTALDFLNKNPGNKKYNVVNGILCIDENMQLNVILTNMTFFTDYYYVYNNTVEHPRLALYIKFIKSKNFNYLLDHDTTKLWMNNHACYDYYCEEYKILQQHNYNIYAYAQYIKQSENLFVSNNDHIIAISRILKILNVGEFKKEIYFNIELNKYNNIRTNSYDVYKKYKKFHKFMVLKDLLSKVRVKLQQNIINFMLDVVYEYTEILGHEQKLSPQTYNEFNKSMPDLFSYINSISTTPIDFPDIDKGQPVTMTIYKKYPRRVYFYDEIKGLIYKNLWCDVLPSDYNT